MRQRCHSCRLASFGLGAIVAIFFESEQLQEILFAGLPSVRVDEVAAHAHHHFRKEMADRQMRERRRRLLHVGTVIFVCFFNAGFYVAFTGLCIVVARPPCFSLNDVDQQPEESARMSSSKSSKILITFNRRDTAAICFCAAAKGEIHLSERTIADTALGLTLGAPLIAILFAAYDERTIAILTIPIALYQGARFLDCKNQRPSDRATP